MIHTDMFYGRFLIASLASGASRNKVRLLFGAHPPGAAPAAEGTILQVPCRTVEILLPDARRVHVESR